MLWEAALGEEVCRFVQLKGPRGRSTVELVEPLAEAFKYVHFRGTRRAYRDVVHICCVHHLGVGRASCKEIVKVDDQEQERQW